ncbi:MAG: cytochrome b N-terminal domain-containing protein [Thermogutta sp.]
MMFADWLDDRIGWRGIWRASCGGGCDSRGRCWWPISLSVIFFLLVQQSITGFFLWVYYSPSSQTAWESVYFIQHQVWLGWLLRGIHFWSAQVLVGFLAISLAIRIFRGFYRAPREWVFWTGLLLFAFALGSCLTGDLLRWDQEGYAATQTRVSFLMLLPKVGSSLYRLAAGGPEFGHHTLTRFFALHVGVLGFGLWLIAVAHAALARRASRAAETTPERYRHARPDPRFPVAIQGLACLIALAVVLLFVFHKGLPGIGKVDAWQSPETEFGASLGAPADLDPAYFYGAARPEWSFRGLYGFSNMFPGELKILPIFVIPGILALLVLAMPLVGIWRVGHYWNLLLTSVLIVGLGYFTYTSYSHDMHDEGYQLAKEAAEKQAQRTLELISISGGIPPAGALALVRHDPKLEGPRVFEQQCASCHNFSGPKGMRFLSDAPSAPELFEFASREWLKSFLDAKQIASEHYYGNTRFAAGAMVRYVEDRFAKLPEGERAAIIAALSAEAQLPRQRQMDEKDAAIIAQGKDLIVRECARCHHFHGSGPGGKAPDLTGYGSRKWLIGIVASPGHSAFYGLRNDRMPQYVEDSLRPEKNRITEAQLSVVADFLRGDWPEPGVPEGGDTAVPLPVVYVLGQWDAVRIPLEKRPSGDAMAEARWLWQKELCSLCHAHSGEGLDNIPAVSPCAPDLGGFASRDWLAGLLDPKQVDSPKYFGTSAFAKGSMVKFVKGNLKELIDEIGKDEFQKLIDALAAEARKDWKEGEEPEEPEKDVVLLFEDFTCTDCHRFYSSGSLGQAPDLTAYGSKKWLAEFIADPKAKQFYRQTNDGMPSYHAFPDHPEKNLLTPAEVEILAEYLSPGK